MGVILSCTEDRNRLARSKEIEKTIRQSQKYRSREIKLLLLGPSDSGKSTIFKQMRLWGAEGFSKMERETLRGTVHQNILEAVTSILKYMGESEIPFSLPTSLMDAETLLKKGQEKMDWAAADAIRRLWRDSGFRDAVRRGADFHLPDSTRYFFDGISRISAQDYCPTLPDILRVRIYTTGVIELCFDKNNFITRVIDVGGQRSERKKWIHQFEDVNAVIFITSLSEYNQKLKEDNTTNRMRESLRLFDIIINNGFFQNSSAILFLNKKDIFAEKLTSFPLSDCFQDYKGTSYEEAWKFIEEQFLEKKLDEKKYIYTHATCATDMEQVPFVLETCFDMVIENNVEKIGLQ